MNKICSKCSRELPSTPVYFYRHRNMKDGLNTVCKECEGQRFKEPRSIPVSNKKGYKICSKCKRELPETLEYFFTRKVGKNGLMSYCKECSGHKFMKKYVYDEKNKKCPSCKKVLPYTEEYFARTQYTRSGLNATCKKCVSSYSKKHYKQNKDKLDKQHKQYYKLNKEKVSERIKKYRNENQEKVTVIWQRRRSKLKNLAHNFSSVEWIKCKEYFNNKCCYCGEEKPLTQDHFISLNKNGEYTKQNIIPACLSCNSSKGDKLFSEWYHKQDFYEKVKENKISEYLNYKQGIQQITLF